MRLEIKNRLHRYYVNRPKPRHGYKQTKCKMCISLMMVIFQAQFMRKLSNSEAELKKSVAHNKSVYMLYVVVYSCMHALIFILTNLLYVPVGQEAKKNKRFHEN